MSAATLDFGDPPLASPELALVDAALAAELRRSLPDHVTPVAPPSRDERSAPLTVLTDTATPEPEAEAEAEAVAEAEAEPEAETEPEAEHERASETELTAEIRLTPEPTARSMDESVHDLVLDPVVAKDAAPQSCDDLIVGYYDEQPANVSDSVSETPELLETVDPIQPDGDPLPDLLEAPQPPAGDTYTAEHRLDARAIQHEAMTTHDCEDLIVGAADAQPAAAPVSAYPTLPAPEEEFDHAEETDIALRNIQQRLTAGPAASRKRRFRRRFTLLSGVLSLSAVVALTAQMYAGVAS